MNGIFNKKANKRDISRKEVIDSVKISIEKNNKALDYLKSIEVAEVYKEHIEYLKFMCVQVDKMYKKSLKRLGGK